MDCNPPSSSVHRIIPARILEWAAISSFRGIFTTEAQGKPLLPLCVLAAQLCPTLCNPMDWGLPGSSVHRIFQARILQWVAILFSRGSSRSRDRTTSLPHCRKILYCLSHQGLFGMLLKDYICLKYLHGSWLSVVLPWSPVTYQYFTFCPKANCNLQKLQVRRGEKR